MEQLPSPHPSEYTPEHVSTLTETAQDFYPLAIENFTEQEAAVTREHTGILIDRENPTAQRLEQAISETGGAIPYSRFMEESLFGADGYYSAGHARIRGHFITSPELSEGFNTSMGEACRKVWQAMDKPGTFSVVEMGAGNGTMAKDILVWARRNHPDFYDALSYTIVEYGDLADKQRTTIGSSSFRSHAGSQASTAEEHALDIQKVTWLRDSAITADFGEFEGVFLSNELPDAFPVEVVRNQNGRLEQKYIGIEEDEWIEVWQSPSADVLNHIAQHGVQLAEGCAEPINLNAAAWQQHLAESLVRGAIITTDYGQFGPNRASKATRTFPEKVGSEYRNPGFTDITADVNFETLQIVAERAGLTAAFACTQAEFLLANGFPPPDELEQHLSGVDLMGAKRMFEGFGSSCQTLMVTKELELAA